MPHQLHEGQPVFHHGARLHEARSAMIMLHGRGASAQDILALASQWRAPDVAFLAPQAANNTWYPNRFIAPIASNEPWLTSALEMVAGVLAQTESAGIPAQRTLLLGFSQGACLALEFAARHPRHYGGVVGLSGALIENGDQPRAYTGSLAGTPVFLGCSDVDFHIPAGRLDRSADILSGLGAAVTKRIYPGMGHTINADEMAFVQQMIAAIDLGVGA